MTRFAILVVALALSACAVGTKKSARDRAPEPIQCPAGAIKQCDHWSSLRRHRGEECVCVSRQSVDRMLRGGLRR